MEGWSEGLGPTCPVIRGSRLYGRGTTDDGYALPTSALILKALQDHSIPHGKIVLIGENEEESDNSSLVEYINILKPEIGNVDIVVCFDAAILTYDRLWTTTSLRGIMNLDLTVKVSKAPVYSAEGIVPCPFRVLRILINRVEDEQTGRILIPELHSRIQPQNYIEKAETVAVIGKALHELIPLEPGVGTVTDDLVQMYIQNTFTPTLVVTGIQGIPSIKKAVNIVIPEITARLSIRVPPGVDSVSALEAVKKELLRDPPYNCLVKVEASRPDDGWAQKPNRPWLDQALDLASEKFFGKTALKLGDGGTIPFIEFLDQTFPSAQFVVTGLLGTDSNAHSADENLDIPYLKNLTCCMVEVFKLIDNNRI
jgi:acetylornithine deacetylase/succinyl-diaminopimelate desuccinylase-like protein